jgi:hypothetical protein
MYGMMLVYELKAVNCRSEKAFNHFLTHLHSTLLALYTYPSIPVLALKFKIAMRISCMDIYCSEIWTLLRNMLLSNMLLGNTVLANTLFISCMFSCSSGLGEMKEFGAWKTTVG